MLVELACNDNAIQTASAPLPTTYDAINRNGIVVFLVANLLTGAINMTMQTMYSSDRTALAVVLGYSGIIVLVAWRLRHRRLRV